MAACRLQDDVCTLLPNTPASEVTKEAILEVIRDSNPAIISAASEVPPLTYLMSLYWTIMTLMTVGYGDLSLPTPGSMLPYWILVLEIFTIMVFVPATTSRLQDTLKNQSPYRTKTYTKSSEETHIIICGSVVLDAMETFCKELFHNDHDNMKGQAVIV